ncbi:MAG TPA: 3'-5' exonuclease [Candidatus Aminicenantes bacterium]|nr:3'-5' exonuclease [Candidatus Aminicenantes bacterium]
MAARTRKLLFFDCETTGLPGVRFFTPAVVDEWPRLVQIAWAGYGVRGRELESRSRIVKPEGFRIPAEATRIHGISHARAVRQGRDLGRVLDEFLEAAMAPGTTLVAHNLDYDRNVVAGELVRTGRPLDFLGLGGFCTMKKSTDICRIARPGGGFGYKWPTLEELHTFCFGFPYDGAHDAANDIGACARSFFKLRAAGHFRL